MSLGSTYNNNQGNNVNKTPDYSTYSNYRMNNAESTIDASCITFRFWRTNLCIGIFPKKETNNDEVSFDMDNGITIYLSHTKARILKAEIENFLKDPITYNGVGVDSGSAVITISNGLEYGKETPVITIRKINENGEVTTSFAYEFKRNYYSIRNYDGKNFDNNYDDYKNIEVEQLVTLLGEFIKASTNAIAFSVMNQRQYSANRVENKIDSIAAALGVETKSNSNSSGNRNYGNSYFNKGNRSNDEYSSSNSNVSYSQATIDDLE